MSNALPKQAPRTRQMLVNGNLIDFDDATVHLMSPAMRYGLNIFEGLRGYWNESEQQLYVFRLREHLERFVQSMKMLRFEPEFGVDEVEAGLLKLLQADQHRANCHIRTTAYLDGIGEHHVVKPVSWMVYAGPRPRNKRTETGIKAQISTWRRISDNALPPRIKCGANYVNARLARMQAQADGYDDAIMLNDAGKVGEGPGACLFMVRRGCLVTPTITSGILESITRDTVIDLASERGIAVEERTIDRTELYACDEVFMAGSAAEILPVVSIDGYRVGNGEPGDISKDLQTEYFAAVTGERYRELNWLSAVYQEQAVTP